MPTNDFLPFGLDVAANVMTQSAYNALPARSTGFQAGLAESAQLNKVWRQSSFMSSALGEFIKAHGQDALDNGTLADLLAAFEAALTAKINAVAQNGFSTGDGKLTLKTAADTGWVMMNDGTIGDATSGATTRANADTSALYGLLWANVGDTFAPVTGGRGANAAADFAAHKPLRLTKQLGRAIIIAGAGSGLTSRALGEILGEEAHALTAAENGTHTHTITVDPHTHTTTQTPHAHSGVVDDVGSTYVGNEGSGHNYPVSTSTAGANANITINNATATATAANSGLGDAHNNMQPSTAWNVMIKL